MRPHADDPRDSDVEQGEWIARFLRRRLLAFPLGGGERDRGRRCMDGLDNPVNPADGVTQILQLGTSEAGRDRMQREGDQEIGRGEGVDFP
jgi:hypothetical protein